MPTHQTDALHRFLFEELNIRGQLVRLDQSWGTMLRRRAYPESVRQVLGDTLVATALLGATIKFRGRLIVQLQSSGPLHMVVAHYSHAGKVRGLARWRGQIKPRQALRELCPDGTLVATIEPERGEPYSKPYQGIVSLQGHTVAEALEQYFDQSEQLPTRLKLASTETTAAGLLLQCMPGHAPDPDGWERVQQLGATLTEPELLSLDAKRVVQRLFHQETVRLFKPDDLVFECACSRERTAAMLTSLGQDEVRDILHEQGAVSITCEFCGQDYAFDAVDAESLFSAHGPLEQDATRH